MIKSISIFGALTLLLMALTIPGHAQETPKAELERLYQAPHGVLPLSGDEIVNLWEKVKANPEPYLPHLLEDLNLDVFQTGTRDQRNRARAAASFIGALDHPRVGAILADVFQQVSAMAPMGDPTGEVDQTTRELVQLRRSLLDVMGQNGHAQLVKACRDSLEHEDYATQIVIRRYLRRVAPERPDTDKERK